MKSWQKHLPSIAIELRDLLNLIHSENNEIKSELSCSGIYGFKSPLYYWLYIGRAGNLYQRVQNHISLNSSNRSFPLKELFITQNGKDYPRKIFIYFWRSKREDILEPIIIKSLKPIYNRVVPSLYNTSNIKKGLAYLILHKQPKIKGIRLNRKKRSQLLKAQKYYEQLVKYDWNREMVSRRLKVPLASVSAMVRCYWPDML